LKSAYAGLPTGGTHGVCCFDGHTADFQVNVDERCDCAAKTMVCDDGAVAWVLGLQVGQCGDDFVCDGAPCYVGAAVHAAICAASCCARFQGHEREVCDEVLDRGCTGKRQHQLLSIIILEKSSLCVGHEVLDRLD